MYDYEAQSSQELSFSKGDFFHVIGRENDPDWYEACNPALPDARGLVPVAFFQALGRTERDSAQSDGGRPPTAKSPDHDSGYSENSPQPIAMTIPPTNRNSKSNDIDNKIFAIVMYDFEAQRADELGATKGEQIIIIAQSTAEWFVAKPIARLGGPGLIPVSYVEIRYVKTREVVPNALEAVRRAGVPSVEEWKKMAANYKNSSITLGKFEGGAGAGGQQAIEQGMERMSLQAGRQSLQNTSQVCLLITAVDSHARQVEDCEVHSTPLLFVEADDSLQYSIDLVKTACHRLISSRPISRVRSSMRLRKHGFPATALPRKSIGLSLSRYWKTADTGSCRAITKISTISKSLS